MTVEQITDAELIGASDHLSEVPVLSMLGIEKRFPGVIALSDVDLELYPGQVTALIGENGAGKSTLVKILAGIYQPDTGTIQLKGQETQIHSAEQAMKLGVSIIHQETVLFDELTVTENIFMGQQLRSPFGFLDWTLMAARAEGLLKDLEADIKPNMRLKDLGIAQKHLVAIARALSVDSSIVVMDEPTAALSHKEVEELYSIVEMLKKQGKAILFISHKFEEIFRIADRYTVFRDGVVVGKGLVRDTTSNDLITQMVGRNVETIFPKKQVEIGAPVLRIEDFQHSTEFADISFDVKRGEILGFYGLVGAGRSEVMQAIFGMTKPLSGRLWLEDSEISVQSPSDAAGHGIVYVPEERQRQGAVVSLPIFQNITLPSLRRLAVRGFLNKDAEFQLARTYAERLELKAASLSHAVETLSGGNQQKVVIGKWLATKPKVIILDEPTKGIDVGSKAAVHGFMTELVEDGLSVIMVSSELPEILGMSDRIAVMRAGRIETIVDRDKADAETLIRLAIGTD